MNDRKWTAELQRVHRELLQEKRHHYVLSDTEREVIRDALIRYGRDVSMAWLALVGRDGDAAKERELWERESALIERLHKRFVPHREKNWGKSKVRNPRPKRRVGRPKKR